MEKQIGYKKAVDMLKNNAHYLLVTMDKTTLRVKKVEIVTTDCVVVGRMRPEIGQKAMRLCVVNCAVSDTVTMLELDPERYMEETGKRV